MASGLGIQNRTGADQNVSGAMALREFSDRFHRSGESEGNFHGGYATFGAGGGDTAGLVRALGPDDNDQAGIDDLIQQLQLLHLFPVKALLYKRIAGRTPGGSTNRTSVRDVKYRVPLPHA